MPGSILGNQNQTTVLIMVSRDLTNIQMFWVNNGQPMSNHYAYNLQPVLNQYTNIRVQYWGTTIKPVYNGFILVIFWPYTVLPILDQYRSHVQTITLWYWSNIGPIWDRPTGITILVQSWHNHTANTGPILVQYNHVYWAVSVASCDCAISFCTISNWK